MQTDLRPVESSRTARYVRTLSAVRRTDVDRVGHKAANLGELAALGFTVPDAVVITAEAFDEVLAGLGEPPSAELVLSAPIPRAVDHAVRAALGELADVPAAVRSSSVAEDRPDASFAGQYDTVLDVRGPTAILDAVRRCWASAFSPRAEAYRARNGDDLGAMAVIVQRLVPADASGVCFTANPVTGNLSEAVVNAVRGLGDRLVSGEVTPDEWLVGEGDPRCIAAHEGALDPAQAERIAALAREIERCFDGPQDVEWALSGDTLHVLQARPITALPDAPAEPMPTPVPIPIEVPDGYWERDASHNPKAGSYLGTDILEPIVNSMHGAVLAEAGFLMEDFQFAQIGGLLYMRMVPLGGKARKPPPTWMMAILRRIVPSIRRRVARSVERVRTGWFETRLERWWSEWRPAYTQRIDRLRSADLAALADEALLEHLARTRELLADALRVHVQLTFSYVVVLARFVFIAEAQLGWDTDRAMGFFTGLSHMSTEPGRALAPLVALAAESAPVRAALTEPGAGGPAWTERLRRRAPAFADAWQHYVDTYGCRAIRYEIIDPNLDETPEVLARVLRGALARGYDAEAVAADAARRRQALLDQLRRASSNRTDAERAELEHRMAAAERAYGVREDNEFFTIGCTFGLLRTAALECGRRLAARGVLRRRDDVFFLAYDELQRAIREGGPLEAPIAERRGRHAWANQRVGTEPASYGTPPSPPGDLSWLPPEAAEVMRALVWFGTHMIAATDPQEGDGLSGIGAGPGVYEGVVRVVHEESEFHKLQPGDVLVCPITSPVWSVLFPLVGALVTDTGGLLSHSAIIAREYGIPAVVGTGKATEKLTDGQRVRVDGTVGRIEVLS